MHVLLGSRSVEKGEAAVEELKSRNLPGKVELVQVDVADEKSIVAAAQHVQDRHGRYVIMDKNIFPAGPITDIECLPRIDALVNNAGIAPAGGSLFQELDRAFRTNATGPAAMVEAFAPLLEKASGTARIVNVTSGAGSIALRLDASTPTYQQKAVPYRASKAALNMLTACQAVEYGPRGWKVFAYCPGFTASNLSPLNTVEQGAKPTSEGARPIVDILSGQRDEEHGGYLKIGGQYAW